MEKKQTAVQYYATMAENIKYKYSLNIINTIEYYEELLDTLNKALEMEKEQICYAYGHGHNNGYMYRDGQSNIIEAEQYYKKTYKSE